MARYLGDHEPLCRELPGLRRLELSSPLDALALSNSKIDRRGPPLLVSELYFDDRAAFELAIASPAGGRMLTDLEAFAADQVSMYTADVERDHAPPG